MRCYPDALHAFLGKRHYPCYFLYGNEPLLIEESASLVRTAIKSADPDIEHLVFTLESGNSALLASLTQVLQNRSLFSQKRLIEIRISAKLTTSDIPHLEKILEIPDDDTLLLLQNAQLSKQNQQAKWFTLIEQKGLVVVHWPLSLPQFEKWIEAQIKEKGLRLAPEALRLLIYHTEGNCLAARQEIERLSLYYADLPEKTTITHLDQRSQFDIFDLCEAALQGQPHRIIKILNALKLAGTAPAHLLWALAQTLRVLLRCLSAISLDEKQRLLQQAGIRVKSQALYLKTLKNIRSDRCTALLTQLSFADKQLKSGEIASFWRALLEVTLKMTGNLSFT